MYIDSGLFFHWIHLPITTQHINHLCVSDAFFKGTFHKYKPTNKFFWTCIVKLTTIRHLTWQAHSVRIISIWTQYHGQLYWLFCTKKKTQRIKIWKHPNRFSNLAEYRKENLFFFGLDDKMLHIWNYHLVFITDSKKKGLGFKISVSTTLCDPMLTNGMQKLKIKRKEEKLCMLKKITSWWLRFQEFAVGSKSLSF